MAQKLTHVDLSGQPICTLRCFPNQKSETVGFEVLILNDCLCSDENSFSKSIIKRMSKLAFYLFFAFVFSLCVKGITLLPIDVRFIVDRCKNQQLMEVSHSTDERDDKCHLLASECDVSLFIY